MSQASEQIARQFANAAGVRSIWGNILVNVKAYGAAGDGLTDDTAAIKSALVVSNRIYFPSGTYLISATIRSSVAVYIDGAEDAIIKAAPGFTGINVTDTLSTPIALKAIFAIFDGSVIHNTAGNRIASSQGASSYIGKITLDCDGNCDYGIYIERAPYTTICADVYSAAVDGIHLDVYCWGSQLIHNKIQDCVTSGIYIGDGANGVKIDAPTIWGNPTRTTYGIYSYGNNNGVEISGGFVERVTIGVYTNFRSGAHVISGVDFEDITLYDVKVNHDLSEGRSSGPIIIDGCYMDSNEENVHNTNGKVMVRGCRHRTPAATSGSHYYSANSTSIFELDSNMYDSAGATISENLTGSKSVTSRRTNQNSHTIINKKTKSALAYESGYSIINYLSRDQPEIVSSSLEFLVSNQGGGTSLFTGKAILKVNQTNTSAGNPQINSYAGVELHSIGSTNALLPSVDNAIKLGTSANRWSEVFAGTGTINTSDAREKTVVSILTGQELNAAKQLSKEIGTYKFLSAVTQKGEDARFHIGMTVQRAIEIMVANGLDPYKYGFICYDTWEDEIEEVGAEYDPDGNKVKDGVPTITRQAGDRFGFRTDELLLFIARGFEERLSALEING